MCSSPSGSITHLTEMSGKLVIAVILALQVTVSLCTAPDPDKDLVEKYTALRDSFYKRMTLYFGKAKTALVPLAEHIPHSDKAKEYVEDLQGRTEVQAAVKIGSGVAGEMAPMVDKARTAALGLYGEHIRPWAGTYLDQLITSGKAFLDILLPIDE
ncbi:hypothetical protein COCON_G00003450 [Conger conger]|uniref:Apolipoprotein A-II n=1 Tax=Conger conger TaxID=82655 RepID=A0A9Q1I8C4_CONCO|nr:hypothetical protein COCON_G00003450 [Conger conger]